MVLFYGQCEAKSKRHHKLISIYSHLKYWFSFFNFRTKIQILSSYKTQFVFFVYFLWAAVAQDLGQDSIYVQVYVLIVQSSRPKFQHRRQTY